MGSHLKYEYDERLDVIALDYVFNDDFYWPHNYGYIPQTRGGDGDQLDVFVLTRYPLAVGTIVHARPVGMIELLDRGEEDNKILAVPVEDKAQALLTTLADFPPQLIEDFQAFIKKLAGEKEKTLEIISFREREDTLRELKRQSSK